MEKFPGEGKNLSLCWQCSRWRYGQHISNWFPEFCDVVRHASSCHDTKGWSTCNAATKPEGWPWIWTSQWYKDDCCDTWSELLEVEITSGVNKGNRILIPCITIAPSDTELPFTLKRRQFPIRPCFAMSTNKAQGQTLQFVGIYLPDHVFTHGQLYVAFSRVTDPSALAVYINKPDGFTRNICVSGSFVTLHVHSYNHEISVLPHIPCTTVVGN